MTYFDRASINPLELDAEVLGRCFNREPFGFRHNLSTLDIFELGSLEALAGKYAGREADYSLASGAVAPGQAFRAVPAINVDLSNAFPSLGKKPVRILLKRPENYDPRFRELRDNVMDHVLGVLGGLKHDRTVRLFSSIFISS